MDAPRAAYVRLSSPITTPACDEAGVTDVMALVVPYPAISADYDLLMTLTGWLQRAENRDALRHASTAADVQALLVREGPW